MSTLKEMIGEELIHRLEAENRAMREALKPFAALAEEFNRSGTQKKGHIWGFDNAMLTYEDFRAAFAALNGSA